MLIYYFLSIRNYTIRFMPVPIMDAAQALKASPEKTEDALLKVVVLFRFFVVVFLNMDVKWMLYSFHCIVLRVLKCCLMFHFW